MLVIYTEPLNGPMTPICSNFEYTMHIKQPDHIVSLGSIDSISLIITGSSSPYKYVNLSVFLWHSTQVLKAVKELVSGFLHVYVLN